MQPDEKIFPGRPRRLARVRRGDIALIIVILVFLFLLVHDVIRVNATLFGITNPGWKELQLLPAQSCATVLAGLLAFWLAREQFRANSHPYLVYDCSEQSSKDSSLSDSSGKERCWKVILRNAGSGMALLYGKAIYRIRIKDAKYEQQDFTYKGAIDYLTDHGLQQSVDFIICHADGEVFAGKHEKLLAVFSMHAVKKLTHCDVTVLYETIFGDRYLKEIWCIPRTRRAGWD